jgi:hypothetical protein
MATTHLQIPDIAASQNQKEVTANAAHDLLDKAMNANASVVVSAGENNLTTAQTRENFVLEATGTPGAAVQMDMPDTNKRTMAIVNNADDTITVRNSANGGTGQPVIAVGEASIFHYDGTNFFDLSDLAIAATNFLGLTDTPSAFTNESGKIPRVNSAENALEFFMTVAKEPVRVATVVNGALATAFENGDTVDGITLATGNRILLKNQSTASENGVYTVNATGAPTRALDFDDNSDVTGGVLIPVLEGDVNATNVFMLSNTGTITIGTTGLTFRDLNPVLGEIYVSAEDMHASVGAAALATTALTSGNPDIRAWALDQTTPETVQFALVMPKDWDLGTIDVDIHWSHTSGGTAFVARWGVAAVSIANDGAQDVAFGTQVAVDDTGGTADDLYIVSAATITVGGTPADGDLVHFEIERIAGHANDTLDLDARLQGIRINYTKL